MPVPFAASFKEEELQAPCGLQAVLTTWDPSVPPSLGGWHFVSARLLLLWRGHT